MRVSRTTITSDGMMIQIIEHSTPWQYARASMLRNERDVSSKDGSAYLLALSGA